MFSSALCFIAFAGTALVSGIPQQPIPSSASNSDPLQSFFEPAPPSGSQGPAPSRPSNQVITFQCPELNGNFEDLRQCDKYYVCVEGQPIVKYCEDGLVFDKLKPGNDPCDSPYVVDCAERTELQEPTFVSEFCPRKNGAFSDPNPAECGIFYTCVNGVHSQQTCSSGLHYDERNGNCAWPEVAQREGCSNQNKALANGFVCPAEQVVNDHGIAIPHPSYPDEIDCQKFYTCLNGKTAQEASCPLGQVFNEKSMICDFPENVPECYGWYREDPRFAQYYDDTVPGPDVGAQDTPL